MNNIITYLTTLLIGFCAGVTCVYALLWYKKYCAHKINRYKFDELNDDNISTAAPVDLKKEYVEKTNTVLKVTLYDKNLDRTRRKKKLHSESEV
jgi:hypothetical protein